MHIIVCDCLPEQNITNITVQQFNAALTANSFTIQQTVAFSIGYGVLPSQVPPIAVYE